MRPQARLHSVGARRFFRLIFVDESLASFYYKAFNLKYYGKFAIDEIEGLQPFERDLYFDMLIQKLEEEREAMEKARGG